MSHDGTTLQKEGVPKPVLLWIHLHACTYLNANKMCNPEFCFVSYRTYGRRYLFSFFFRFFFLILIFYTQSLFLNLLSYLSVLSLINSLIKNNIYRYLLKYSSMYLQSVQLCKVLLGWYTKQVLVFVLFQMFFFPFRDWKIVCYVMYEKVQVFEIVKGKIRILKV